MTKDEILNTLDNSNDGYYCSFVALGNVSSYLIDCRLNVFFADDRWVIAIERLGYNPRAGAIMLEINYYGNCLTNLEYYNERPTSNYSVCPIDTENFENTIDGESLKTNANFWLVRGQQVSLSSKKQDYIDAGIELMEFEPNEISIEEAARLSVSQNRELFRATNKELYKSIPTDLSKIVILDEWFHKDFQLQNPPMMSFEHLQQTYELNKNLTGLGGMTFETFSQATIQKEMLNDTLNKEIWETNRPSSYETWQQIANVIATREPSKYNPTLKANTHWTNWPESGSM